MSRWVPLLLALVLGAVAFSPLASVEAAAPTRMIVGYDPADERGAQVAINAAGGTLQKTNRDVGLAIALTSDPDHFKRVVTTSPSVRFAERDDPIRLAGAQWNGAQWNGAQWNGAQWNGAQWNGAQWNSARTDGAQWNGAQWNAAQWSIDHYRTQRGNDWQYDLARTDPGVVWQWGLWALDAPDAWLDHGYGDRRATLCVLDSGVAWDHPDLAGNMWVGPNGERGYNAIDPLKSAYDDAGHGTHIAGIAGGVSGNAFGIAGVGNVLIMPVKVLDASGYGYEGDLAFGIAWCAKQGADVAVMALSATAPGPSMDLALGYAAAHDVLMLASAGNTGPCEGCVAYPANDPRVVGVSAVDGNLARAPFSASGPEVDFAAPGVDVLSTLPGGAFAFGSGTSQAVAFAAGVATALRDERPDLTASQALARMTQSAVDLGAPGRDVVYGAGMLNLHATLDSASS